MNQEGGFFVQRSAKKFGFSNPDSQIQKEKTKNRQNQEASK